MPKDQTLLIDGDILVYRTAAALETPIEWEEDFWTLHTDLKAAKDSIHQQVEELQDTLKSISIVVALGHPSGVLFRKQLCPSYKENRKGTRKPIGLLPLREWVRMEYSASSISRLEADDVLGLLQKTDGSTIICSIDKDLRQIPGLHWNLDKGTEEGITEVTPEMGSYMHLYQTLIGDTSDGYPGLPGCGPKTAEKILTVPTWEAVVAAYQKAGSNATEALLQARLAYILRAGDYNLDNKTVKLWQPPTV